MAIGISIYPLVSNVDENIVYIEKAAKLGYTRLFTSMLELDHDEVKAKAQVEEFRVILNHAKKLGFENFVDVNPEILKLIGIGKDDLNFFVELGATGIRMDGLANGFYEVALTHNKLDLKIEINGSFDTGYVDNICDLHPNMKNLTTCHNFYPELYTGLALECVIDCHKRHKRLNLHTAAFVNANQGGMLGPWPCNDGLPTVEAHRYLPIDVQAQELLLLGIDDILIGNAFATDEELERLANVESNVISLKVKVNDDIDDSILEKLNGKLANRYDYSDYIIRHYATRLSLKNLEILPNRDTNIDVKYGCVAINNDLMKNYKGELIVFIKDCNLDTRRNIIGQIDEDYLRLVKYIGKGTNFRLEFVR